MRLIILYGSECWTVDNKIEQRMRVTVIRILRLISRVTREDKIRNEYVRASIEVISIVNMKKNRL